MIMRGIILAAGENIRLKSITNSPKSLLKIGNCCFLDRITILCKKYAFHQIVMVVGHKAEEIERHIKENPEIFGDIHVKTIYNRDYASKNNIFSFWLAHREMDKPFVLFNSDVLFHEAILELLLKTNVRSALMVDDRKTLGQEDMKVIMDKRLIRGISKDINPSLASEEYIGLAKFFDRGTVNNVLSKCKLLLDLGRTDVFYEEAFRLLSIEEPSIYGVSTNGLPWIEVDTPEDYQKAKRASIPSNNINKKAIRGALLIHQCTRYRIKVIYDSEN